MDHDKLDVYRAAREFVRAAEEIAAGLPSGRAYLADQLRRSALSIPLNVAEGAGEFSPNEKARFYRIAKRSATESAASIDAALDLKLADEIRCDRAKILLDRIVAMLTAMLRHTDAEHASTK